MHVSEGGGGGGGGGFGSCTQERFSNFGNNRFFKQRNCRKLLVSKEEFIGNINLHQTSRLNLDKFGINNDIPDCRSAAFT